MSGPVFIPKVNFSFDLRPLSLLLALALAGLSAAALIETGVLLWDSSVVLDRAGANPEAGRRA